MSKELLKSFSEIVIEKPVDKIIQQIRELISSGQLKPGDKLPSERMLSEKFGVGRTYVRDAIKKLEFYGILKTLPQSGTVVAGFGIVALEGLITDVLMLERHDFHSLVETRVLLESNTAKMAALKRTDDDIVSISKALSAYEVAVKKGNSAVEEDLLFHLEIAKASKNSVLKSLMMIVTPDILTFFKENDVCAGDRPKLALEEHHTILDYIIKKDAVNAELSMRAHLNDILNFYGTTNST
ncbi:MAG: FadR family transcriptional regulator [Cytophagales bacterium]|nr:FadR family transcriptional regulator [Cytophagales bacterium]